MTPTLVVGETLTQVLADSMAIDARGGAKPLRHLNPGHANSHLLDQIKM